jgi:hypothetical protein
MCGRDSRVDGVILSQESQNLNCTRSVAPVPHQVADDAEEADELHARVRHAVIRHVADELGRGARGLDVGPDVVAFGAQGEGAEGGACECFVSWRSKSYCVGLFVCLAKQHDSTYRRQS